MYERQGLFDAGPSSRLDTSSSFLPSSPPTSGRALQDGHSSDQIAGFMSEKQHGLLSPVTGFASHSEDLDNDTVRCQGFSVIEPTRLSSRASAPISREPSPTRTLRSVSDTADGSSTPFETLSQLSSPMLSMTIPEGQNSDIDSAWSDLGEDSSSDEAKSSNDDDYQ